MVDDVTVEAAPREPVEVVYEREGRKLLHALIAFSGDPDVANDAMAEAFAQLMRRGPSVRDPARWVWRAAFKIANGELATRNKLHGEIAAWVPSPTLELTDRSVDLMDALSRLPTNQRAAVVLHYLADLSTKEIAGRLRVSPVTVRVHLNHGRRRLKELLEDRDG